MANGGPFAAALADAVDPMLLMQRVTDRTMELVAAADGVMVGLTDGDGVVYVCGAGQCAPFLGTRVEVHDSLSGLAVRTGRVLRSDDTEHDPRVDADACRRLSVASLVCVPLFQQHHVIGVLAVNAARPYAFADDDVAALTRMASFVSVAVATAWELSRVSTQLLEAGVDATAPVAPEAAGAAAHSASRFVVGVLSPELATLVETRARIQQVLDDPSSVWLHYQPIVDLQSGRIAAGEALARFALTPARTPDRWFAEAHQVGLGIELELVAVARAVAQHTALPPGVDVTINVGPATVTSPLLMEALELIPSDRVILELTEHVDVEDHRELAAALRGLRRRGVRLAVDDAGSGYSSLALILKLAPDFIKLDRELISGIDVDPVRRALAGALVAFAGDTGAAIVAEGIETVDELQAVQQLGVRYGQGYYLGRPGSIESLAAIVLVEGVPGPSIGSTPSTPRTLRSSRP